MKIKHFLLLLCVMVLLGFLFFIFPWPGKEPVENMSHVVIGDVLTVDNTDSRLVLIDHNSALAADGLYYASWGIGDAVPYENSEGKTVSLYDANLYLLLGESEEHASAQGNMEKWLNAAKTNYEILEEDEITCGGQTYSLFTYNCMGEDNPYAHGISAFGAFGNSAVCIELTCREYFDEDLKTILTAFLNNCSYTID